jgi:hypothetical protein
MLTHDIRSGNGFGLNNVSMVEEIKSIFGLAKK